MTYLFTRSSGQWGRVLISDHLRVECCARHSERRNPWLKTGKFKKVSSAMRLLGTLFSVLFVGSAQAEPMIFERVGNGGNCDTCSYVQATGEIVSATPTRFEAFAKAQKVGVGIVRLHSPGGNLAAGIALGELFRQKGVTTEVGSSAALSEALQKGLYDRSTGICASACAYAFLGGVERVLDENGKLGFHRFYQENALAQPSAKLLTGQDLGTAQMLTAALMLYTVKMGVDAKLVALASSAGPDEMHWISQADAQLLRVVYQPHAYKPWRVEPFKGGAIAIAESNDTSKNVVVSCSLQFGPNVALIDLKPQRDAAAWYEQCSKTVLPDGGQPVLGERIAPSKIRVTRRKDGSIIMRFGLPTHNPPLTSSEFLSFKDGYPRACSSPEFRTSAENFAASVRLAMQNCIQD
ncbi:hypothetical protein ACQR1Q_34955 [Bradyrhizobium oligotrophicum]|uniref:hypothetical protein n=1 Tax=Bradyrhizobium oligotrophicum TaxID=44255 RepID=UPI003EBD3121